MITSAGAAIDTRSAVARKKAEDDLNNLRLRSALTRTQNRLIDRSRQLSPLYDKLEKQVD